MIAAVSGRSATFRDPAGSVVFADEHVYRLVASDAAIDLQGFVQSVAGQRFVNEGKVVRTTVLTGEERRSALQHPSVQPVATRFVPEVVCEHEPIPFPSYPYEWCPEMLHAAGFLTLELARGLMPEGFGVKDATPYNVLFRGPDPVFVDVLSFERRDSQDCLWLAHAQFMRTFVLPLLANKYYGLSMSDVFLGRRDGLEPEEVYGWTKAHQRLCPPFLTAVSIPTWFGNGKQITEDLYKPKQVGDAEKARFVYSSLISRSERLLGRLTPRAGAVSTWSDYATSNNNYSTEAAAAKREFVADAMAHAKPGRVLDVGCNTGEFSKIAAEAGAAVVAIDYDPVVIGNVWRRARASKLPILPLVVNLSRPTPALGWRNQECSSFLERATGSFDLVLMLAVIHHMLVTDRIPLNQIIETAASLTRDWALIEFVGPGDSMFRKITRGRDYLHADLTEEAFVAECTPFFRVERKLTLPGAQRSLYLLRKRR